MNPPPDKLANAGAARPEPAASEAGNGEQFPATLWTGEPREPEININEYLSLLWTGRLIILGITVLVVLLALAWALTRSEVYLASSTVSIDVRAPEIIKNQIMLGPSSWEQERYVREQERVLHSYDLAQQVVQRIGLDGNPELNRSGPTPERLLGMLRVEPVPDTSIVNLSMVGSDPERIAEWLNIYVDEYIRFNIDDSLRRTQQIYEVIQSRLDPLRQQLVESEQRLTSFRERQDTLLSADQDKNVISEQVNTLTTAFAEAKAERIRLETKILALEEAEANALSAVSAPEVLNNAVIQALLRERDGLEVELQERLGTYREGHPVVKDLRGRIGAIEHQLVQQVRTIVDSLRTDFEIVSRREQSLYDSIQQLRDETIELSKQTMEYESLKRDYEQNKAFYEEMLARSKEGEISGTVSYNRVRIIDRARPPKFPISPNVVRTVGLALILGLVLGVGVVLGLDYLDQSLRTPDDVERHLGLDVFSVVPTSADVRQRELLEVYQGLRTALMFAARDSTSQVVMVTSAGPGEGKTTTVFNLAKVLAGGGARVLVLDGDLRKPAFHRLLGIGRQSGLTTLVLGEKRLEEVVYPLEGFHKLDVVTSGPLPPNPPELFGKKAFSELLERSRREYDWVLIDSPPVISVTDAVVCSNLVNMVLLVVQYGRFDRKVVQGALRQLGRGGARVVGTVLNQVDLSKKHYYYDSHYYAYFYGYREDGETPGAEGAAASTKPAPGPVSAD